MKSNLLVALTLSFLSLSFTFSASAQTLQCQAVPSLMSVFLSNHFAVNQLTPEVKDHTVSLFLKFIDPNKQLLFKADVTKMRTQLTDLFETMKSNNCAVLTEISTILTTRAEENLKIVQDKVKGNYVLDQNIKYQTDTKKRDYPENIDQKKALLDAAIGTQVATLMAGDVKLDKAKEQLLKRYELSLKRVKELNQGKMVTTFAESFAYALDPHSDYMSPERLEEFRIQMNLSLEGIGVSLSSEEGYTIVQEIIPGGSADRAKALQPKDKIIAVAQGDKKDATNIIDMDLSDVVKMIRGKKGTKVTLTVVRQKGNKSDTFHTTITRDKVDMKEQAAKVEYQNRKVGDKTYKIAVIDLPSFYGGSDKNSRDCYTDMKKIVEEANAKKVDGIILDLSQDGGGLLQDAVKIAGLFIKTGPVVATVDGKKNREILSDEDPKVYFNGPFMILTTRQSASASEILAGAMKDYKRALIVGGDHTYGKGSVQVLNPLPFNLGAMKLTTQMFYLPGGVSTQFGGVASDVSMPTYLDSDDMGEQYMDYPLPPTKTEPFIAVDAAQGKDADDKWTPVNDEVVKFLKEKSSKRVAENQEFKDIVKDLEESKKNEGWVKVADIVKRSSEKKDKRKEKKDLAATAKGRKELWLKDPHVQEGLNIMTDWLSFKPQTVKSVSN
jgi:carboxyl-terminal processing protease